MVKKIIAVCLIELLLCPSLFAARIPTGQDAGSTVKEYTKEKKQEKTLKHLIAPKIEPPALDEEEAEKLPGRAKSVYISRVIVQQDVYAYNHVKEGEFNTLIKQYENRTLSLQDMKKLAKAITKQPTDKELKAYIPKQSFALGVMYINIKMVEKQNHW